MQLGEVIRTHRKKKNMTQEEMANRLGVTAPAVNKWENGNSYPDILLLAPIARLLDISVDTLLSFREELTVTEINEIVREVDQLLKEKTYDEALAWAKKKLTQYPNCEQLIWQLAVIFDVQRAIQGRESEENDAYLRSLYLRALESKEETLRNLAAGSLFGFYMRKKQYEQAEQSLEFMSELNPQRKQYLARLYSETNRVSEAYKTYEESLFSSYQQINVALQGMVTIAQNEGDWEQVQMLAAKHEEIARSFEMGKYYEAMCWLEPAIHERDAKKVLEVAQKLLAGIEEMGSFCRAPLYAHMTFREPDEEFWKGMRESLLACFRDEEKFDFLKEEPEWQDLVGAVH